MRSLQHHVRRLRFNQSFTYCLALKSRRWFTTVGDVLQEGDRAMLCYKDLKLVLTQPLRRDSKTTTRYGDVSHNNLIGKQARDTVTTSKAWELRTHIPSLEDYVTMTPRLVTPIYAKDANLIVSLLDLHPHATLRPLENYTSLEILEAGTGHGALTLHLARAIHAANPPLDETPQMYGSTKTPQPTFEPTLPVTTSEPTPSHPLAASVSAENTVETLRDTAKVHRRAIIHTVDVSAKHSEYASKIVNGFRRNQYANDVEFYVGDISGWIDEQIIQRKKPGSSETDQAFLSHVILDLPSSQTHIKKISTALHVNGSLLVFNPSITQIVSCVKEIRKKRLPLQLDQILELGQSTGGREWDVRAVKPRAIIRAENEKKKEAVDSDIGELSKDGNSSFTTERTFETQPTLGHKAETHLKDDAAWEMICRPKVGERVVGGGFLGMWKRMRH